MDKQPELILVRGLPGSGKSTYAKNTRMFHVEADMFRYNPDGTYLYSKATNEPTHLMCEKLARCTLLNGYSVVVSNTFIFNQFIEPYIKSGQELQIPIKIIEIKTQFKSIHGVSDAVVDGMRGNWEPIRKEWERYLNE